MGMRRGQFVVALIFADELRRHVTENGEERIRTAYIPGCISRQTPDEGAVLHTEFTPEESEQVELDRR